MKRIAQLVSAGLVLTVLLTGTCGWGTAAELKNPVPADLLNETYNPFFNAALPDGYTLRQVEYDSEKRTYVMYLTAADTEENVVAAMLRLLGNDDPDSLTLCMAFLQEAGAASIETDAGAGCEISNHGENGSYNVNLYQTMASGDMYKALIEANFNVTALGAVADGFDFRSPDQARLTLYIQDDLVVLTCDYIEPNAMDVKAEMSETFKDLYISNGDQMMLRYGDMYTNVQFASANDGLITLEQEMDAMDICFGDYIPPVSLRNFGFDDFREEGAKCTYKDSANGVLLMISRPEWGENEHQSEINTLVFSMEKEQNSWMLFYHPSDGSYLVTLEYGDKIAEYAIRRSGDAYTYFTEGDWQHTKGIAALVFPDSKYVLQEPMAVLNSYIVETFGMDADALFALDYE
jgi:hypothetical protein